jgi:hypothetical protein
VGLIFPHCWSIGLLNRDEVSAQEWRRERRDRAATVRGQCVQERGRWKGRTRSSAVCGQRV